MNEKETRQKSKFLNLVLLKIRAGAMQRAGHEFFVTPNDVWLTDTVPAEFIEFPEES